MSSRAAPTLAQLKAFRSRARWVLYGTIGFCTYTTLRRFAVDSMLHSAVKEQNPERMTAALRRREDLQKQYVCSRKNLSEGRYYTLITSSWNHGDGLHFLGNMLGLWSFGSAIAYGFGAGTFLTIFYGGAVVGNLLCLGMDQRFGRKNGRDGMGLEVGQNRETGGFIGASGGVCAMTAANACLNPLGSMIIGIMFIPVPVPNFIGALGFAGFSAWAQTNEFQGNVAHLGHLGGLLYGFAWFVARFKRLPVMY